MVFGALSASKNAVFWLLYAKYNDFRLLNCFSATRFNVDQISLAGRFEAPTILPVYFFTPFL